MQKELKDRRKKLKESLSLINNEIDNIIRYTINHKSKSINLYDKIINYTEELLKTDIKYNVNDNILSSNKILNVNNDIKYEITKEFALKILLEIINIKKYKFLQNIPTTHKIQNKIEEIVNIIIDFKNNKIYLNNKEYKINNIITIDIKSISFNISYNQLQEYIIYSKLYILYNYLKDKTEEELEDLHSIELIKTIDNINSGNNSDIDNTNNVDTTDNNINNVIDNNNTDTTDKGIKSKSNEYLLLKEEINIKDNYNKIYKNIIDDDYNTKSKALIMSIIFKLIPEIQIYFNDEYFIDKDEYYFLYWVKHSQKK